MTYRSLECEYSWFPLENSRFHSVGVDCALIRTARGLEAWNAYIHVSHMESLEPVDVAFALLSNVAAVNRLDDVRTAELTQSLENLTPLVGQHSLGMSS